MLIFNCAHHDHSSPLIIYVVHPHRMLLFISIADDQSEPNPVLSMNDLEPIWYSDDRSGAGAFTKSSPRGFTKLLNTRVKINGNKDSWGDVNSE